MRFRPCKANAGDLDGGPSAYSATAGKTPRPFGMACAPRRILPWLAMRRTKNASSLGRWRWVIERTFAWLTQFRRLRVGYDERADTHEAFVSLGWVWIGWQSLREH
jgi:transposase